jgi:hypothetical protein
MHADRAQGARAVTEVRKRVGAKQDAIDRYR